MIDAHIHLDLYEEPERTHLLREAQQRGIEGLIGVSMHLDSCRSNLALADQYPGLIHPAFGFHPEQPLPSPEAERKLFQWMEAHASRMVAVGEIGLPYYTRQEMKKRGEPTEAFPLESYFSFLDRMLDLAKRLDKPVVLHAVYEDAELACDLLERHGIAKAHFHWFKGAKPTIRRMAERGYLISFTPDLLYETEIAALARYYPQDLVMAETDGPWPFEGPFAGQPTRPDMIREVAQAWGRLHGLSYGEAADRLTENTRAFYRI
ncbi:TatD-related deoxyribonuclease [Paenibacillus faecis]|uniref:TatD family hydrolase n=1 Tax=Paenibacillus faecis TaxID=862114 RepID=UPI001B046BB6|nr:TatD family hydrolase [Paenibacillus faecis]GIO86897.1 TatD-related deoxyribonuclease [Paenibacillus faecis]